MELEALKQTILGMRRDIVRMVSAAGSGHPGGSLSAADLMGVLYMEQLDIAGPDDPARDRFVLSKGHASPVLYAALAAKGIIPREQLAGFRSLGSPLQGHPVPKTPGVDAVSGSLGLGLSTAVGMALASKRFGPACGVWCMIGDGEMEEGVVWEALMAASHYRLSNLKVIVDNNGLQIDGKLEDVMSPYPIADKLRAFGLRVCEIDGHDIAQIREAYAWAASRGDSPAAVVAKTVKGKGVSFMEGQSSWHGKAPDPDQTAKALEELEAGNGL